jgi:hypothetical protein
MIWPETTANHHYREKDGSPSVLICRRLRAESQTGEMLWLFFFAFFTHAITPPFAARRSDTEP